MHHLRQTLPSTSTLVLLFNQIIHVTDTLKATYYKVYHFRGNTKVKNYRRCPRLGESRITVWILWIFRGKVEVGQSWKSEEEDCTLGVACDMLYGRCEAGLGKGIVRKPERRNQDGVRNGVLK